MKLALGLIETHGLVAAIEAADAMAKAANITIIGKEKSTAALVTIKIVGEVAAVKSAVDAGAAAAQRVGELIATHIIPRPAEEINDLIISSDKIVSVGGNKKNYGKKKIRKVVREDSFFDQKIDIVKNSDLNEKTKENNINVINDEKETAALDVNEDDFKQEFAEVNIDISAEENFSEAADDDFNKEQPEYDSVSEEELSEASPNKYSFKMEELEILNVHQLRKKARNIPHFPIKGRDISKANRGVLLDYFKSLL